MECSKRSVSAVFLEHRFLATAVLSFYATTVCKDEQASAFAVELRVCRGYKLRKFHFLWCALIGGKLKLHV